MFRCIIHLEQLGIDGTRLSSEISLEQAVLTVYSSSVKSYVCIPKVAG